MTSTPRRMAMLIALAMGSPWPSRRPPLTTVTTSPTFRPDRPARRLATGRHRIAWQVALCRLARERRHLARERQDREGKILVPGETGKVAVGLHIDRWGRLWVPVARPARSASKASSGKLLQTYSFGTVPMLFFNDLDISRNRVVVTDSFNARVGVTTPRARQTVRSVEGVLPAAQG